MAEHGRAYDEVKELLSKLDRSIDAARSRRVHGDDPAPESPPPAPRPIEHRAESPAEPASQPRPGASKYGKAKPLRPNASVETGRWRSA